MRARARGGDGPDVAAQRQARVVDSAVERLQVTCRGLDRERSSSRATGVACRSRRRATTAPSSPVSLQGVDRALRPASDDRRARAARVRSRRSATRPLGRRLRVSRHPSGRTGLRDRPGERFRGRSATHQPLLDVGHTADPVAPPAWIARYTSGYERRPTSRRTERAMARRRTRSISGGCRHDSARRPHACDRGALRATGDAVDALAPAATGRACARHRDGALASRVHRAPLRQLGAGRVPEPRRTRRFSRAGAADGDRGRAGSRRSPMPIRSTSSSTPPRSSIRSPTIHSSAGSWPVSSARRARPAPRPLACGAAAWRMAVVDRIRR